MPADRVQAIADAAIAATVEAEWPTTVVDSVRLADVESRPIEWVWLDRVARGRLCLLAGDPGVGKSMLTCALAAAISTGSALPGDVARPPADVLILSAEDSAEDTIRPRCEAMGADLCRIRVVTAVRREGKEGFFSLASDLEALERELEGVSLLIVDPIDAYVGTGIDSHRAAAIRSLLGPLAAMAERAGVAVVVVQHLTKGGRDRAIYRPQGSIGYIAAARTALLVAADPDDPTSSVRQVALLKSNVGPQAATVAFSLEGGRFGWVPCEGGKTAEQLLAVAATGEEQSALAEAEEWLRDALSEGPPVAAKDIQRQGRDAGFSDRTVRRAKVSLGVRSGKTGARGGWAWSLSQGGQGSRGEDPAQSQGGQGGHAQHTGHVGHLGKGAETPEATAGPQREPAPAPGATPPDPLGQGLRWPDGTPYRLPDAPPAGREPSPSAGGQAVES
ncbi:MAG: AAA family ATPase [Candidatus Dormibacteria bacterium]